MGGGYHFEPYHPEGFSSRSIDDIADEIIRDVQVGLDESGIRCGIIGEVGCSWPWTDVEKRSVSAAVAAQQTTGAPLLIHPGLDQKAPVEIAEFIDREGGDLTRTVMSHVDLRIAERSILHELAATGIYIEFDTFGFESAPQQPSPEPPTPTDPERIGMVEWLIEEEFTEQIVLAHDLYTRERRREFGGHGIQHIPTTVVDQMKLQGITQAQIDTMLIENPRRVLTFV
jgi:phosphotriesterase-related protein